MLTVTGANTWRKGMRMLLRATRRLAGEKRDAAIESSTNGTVRWRKRESRNLPIKKFLGAI